MHTASLESWKQLELCVRLLFAERRERESNPQNARQTFMAFKARGLANARSLQGLGRRLGIEPRLRGLQIRRFAAKLTTPQRPWSMRGATTL